MIGRKVLKEIFQLIFFPEDMFINQRTLIKNPYLG
jgi:hypothetical protein